MRPAPISTSAIPSTSKSYASHREKSRIHIIRTAPSGNSTTSSPAPEKSDTYTYGIVLTPDFVEGLSVTIDYYDIKIEDGINNLTPEFILTECLDGDDSRCVTLPLASTVFHAT